MNTAKGMKADPVMRGFLTIPCVQVAPITARNKMLVEDSLLYRNAVPLTSRDSTPQGDSKRVHCVHLRCDVRSRPRAPDNIDAVGLTSGDSTSRPSRFMVHFETEIDFVDGCPTHSYRTMKSISLPENVWRHS
jgi:hypothetical protein